MSFNVSNNKMVPSHIHPSVLETFTTAQWNAVIRRTINQNQPRNAILLFHQMKQQNSHPNNFTFPFIAKACAKLRDIKLSQTIHAHVTKTPYTSDTYVLTALVDMYVKCQHFECSHKLFDEMPARDTASWNAVIVGYAQVGFFDRVALLFNRMRVDGVVPDVVTFIGLTQLVSGIKDGRLLGAVQCSGIKYGFEEDVTVANTWISAYAKCGEMRSAERVFSGIELDSLTSVSWNAMISGFAYVEESVKAFEVYKRMIDNGYKPDLSTILNLVSSFSNPSSLYCGLLVHAHGIRLGCDTDITLRNTLISMYAKCGDINAARYVFDCIDERTCVTWTVMIGGYSEIGDLDEALVLFNSMKASCEKPDLVTILHLVSACGKVGAVEVGKWIDNYTVSEGLKGHVTACNALLDMYVKCGSLIDAQELFRSMDWKTVVSWTTMIAGFALNGKLQAALDHFSEMLKLGIKPNHVTFLAVLQACTHAGFLEKGWEIFNMMTSDFHIDPGLEHYACMTDLLGRKGKVKEALDFILDMPVKVKPDAGIWGALLSACKINQNLEIGEYVAKRLFELEPEAAAPYVEMANIYASAKDWKGVASMKMKMRMNQVVKFPGQSMIIVDGKCLTFTVEDRCQSVGAETFETLDSLVLQLKDELDSLDHDESLL